jgi:drug/metabolite transporter (DMT)-like permease
MPPHLVGEVCALGAAVTWAFALILFKRSGESIPPLSLSLFKNSVVIVLMLATLPIVGQAYVLAPGLSWSDFFILLISGILGIAIADTVLFYSLNLVGVGLVSIAECAYSPTVVLFAWAMLSESIGVNHVVGGALVVCGVLISSTHKPPQDRTRGQVVAGMLLGMGAVTLMSFGIVLAKPILEQAPVLWSATVRLLGGSAMLAILMAASPKRRTLFAVFRPSRIWRFALPGSILGTYVAMLLWIAGFKYTQASIAAILNQTSTVFALILAAVFLREPFSKRKITAALMAFGGVFIVAQARHAN